MRRGTLAALGLAVASTALLARQVATLGWVGLDTFPILLTSRIASPGDLVRLLTRELMDGRYTADFYRPVLGLSVALDHALWGLQPAGYVGTSLVLFGAGGFVVYLVAGRLLGEGAVWGPLAAEMAYFLHPTHLEVVPVLARRADLLCWLFLGLALATVRSRPLAAGMCGFLAMMSKEPALLAPVLALAATAIVPGSVPWRARLRETAPLWIALALALAVRVAVLGGLGGHGEVVRGGSWVRTPGVLAAVWSLLVAPQPVVAAGVVGGAGVVAWTLQFAFAVGLAGRSRAVAVAAAWLTAFGALYAATGGVQAWYLLLPVACFSVLLGAAIETGRRSRGGWGVILAVAILLVWQAAYSPLWVRYDGWARASEASDAFLTDLAARVEAAPPGAELEAPPRPYWIPVSPGRPSLRGAAVLAPYSVEAWLELRFPGRAVRVVSDAVQPGFDGGAKP